MILTSKMFEDALQQINVAFAEVNKRVDKLEEQLKTKEAPSGNTKKGKSKG